MPKRCDHYLKSYWRYKKLIRWSELIGRSGTAVHRPPRYFASASRIVNSNFPFQNVPSDGAVLAKTGIDNSPGPPSRLIDRHFFSERTNRHWVPSDRTFFREFLAWSSIIILPLSRLRALSAARVLISTPPLRYSNRRVFFIVVSPWGLIHFFTVVIIRAKIIIVIIIIILFSKNNLHSH